MKRRSVRTVALYRVERLRLLECSTSVPLSTLPPYLYLLYPSVPLYLLYLRTSIYSTSVSLSTLPLYYLYLLCYSLTLRLHVCLMYESLILSSRARSALFLPKKIETEIERIETDNDNDSPWPKKPGLGGNNVEHEKGPFFAIFFFLKDTKFIIREGFTLDSRVHLLSRIYQFKLFCPGLEYVFVRIWNSLCSN